MRLREGKEDGVRCKVEMLRRGSWLRSLDVNAAVILTMDKVTSTFCRLSPPPQKFGRRLSPPGALFRCLSLLATRIS